MDVFSPPKQELPPDYIPSAYDNPNAPIIKSHLPDMYA